MKVAFFGQGNFAGPIKRKLAKNFGLVPFSQAEILVVASWGEILKKDQFERPRHGTLNIHPSLLPKYRGATPIQAAILNGDRRTGVTIIKMDEKVDHGPVVGQQMVQITPTETCQGLEKKLAYLGAELVVAILANYLTGKIKPRPQDHRQATFVWRLKKDDGQLNLADPPVINDRKVRAFWPWPSAWIKVYPKRSRRVDGQRLFVHLAHVDQNQFIPDLVQLENRRKMTFEEFSRGWRGLPVKGLRGGS